MPALDVRLFPRVFAVLAITIFAVTEVDFALAQSISGTVTVPQQATLAPMAPLMEQLPTGLQAALEAKSATDDLASIVVLCANACEPPSDAQAAGTWFKVVGGYYCRPGRTCACYGIAQCVEMIAIDANCRFATVSCMGAGCRCTWRTASRRR